MLLLLAVFLAIPTYGLSLVAYIGWLVFKRYLALPALPARPQWEQAILIVAQRHNGSLIGTNFSELSFAKAKEDLISQAGFSFYDLEGFCFQCEVTIDGQKFDIHVTKEPDGDGAILRVRKSEPWLDELYTWFREELPMYPPWNPKYFFPSQNSLRVKSHGSDEHLALPESIGRLTQLKELNLNHVGIAVLPRSIGALKQLEVLGLGFNPLSRLPDEICQLTNLKELEFSQTDLKSLPPEIGNLSQLVSLDRNCPVTTVFSS